MSAESKMVEYAASYRQVTSKLNDRPVSLNAVKDILKMANMEEFDIVAYRNIMQLPPVTPQPCENAISREKVMMELDKYLAGVEYEKGIDRIIAELPSVTPQRPKGHWIEERNDYGEIQGWHCDKCYEDSGFTTKCKWDFCPNCGADMRGDNT